MTDNTLMPQQGAAEGGTSRTTLLVAGGLVGLVVLGGGGFLLLSGGSDDADLTGAPVVQRTTTGKTTTTKTTVPARKPATKPAAAKPGVVPAKSTVRIGVDPFKPRFEPPPVVQTQPSAPPASGGSTPVTGGTTTGGATPGLVTGQAYALTLKRIEGSGNNARVYTFVVDGTTKQVVAAQRFGKYGELVVLGYIYNSKGVATHALLQVGDDEPFEMRIGSTAQVQ